MTQIFIYKLYYINKFTYLNSCSESQSLISVSVAVSVAVSVSLPPPPPSPHPNVATNQEESKIIHHYIQVLGFFQSSLLLDALSHREQYRGN